MMKFHRISSDIAAAIPKSDRIYNSKTGLRKTIGEREKRKKKKKEKKGN